MRGATGALVRITHISRPAVRTRDLPPLAAAWRHLGFCCALWAPPHWHDEAFRGSSHTRIRIPVCPDDDHRGFRTARWASSQALAVTLRGKGAERPMAQERHHAATQTLRAQTHTRSRGASAHAPAGGGRGAKAHEVGGRRPATTMVLTEWAHFQAASSSACRVSSNSGSHTRSCLLPEGQKGIGQVTVALATSTAPVAEDLVCAQGTPRAGLVGRVGPRGPRGGARGEGKRAQRAPERCPKEPRGRVRKGRDCGSLLCQLNKD